MLFAIKNKFLTFNPIIIKLIGGFLVTTLLLTQIPFITLSNEQTVYIIIILFLVSIIALLMQGKLASKENITDVSALLVNRFESTTLDAIHDAVLRTDSNGIIIYANQACQTLLSVCSQDLINHRYIEIKAHIITDELDESYVEILAKLQSNDNDSDLYKTTYCAKINCKLLSIEQHVNGIFTDDGTFSGTLIVLRDVTQAEKLRARLKFQANHDSVTKLFNRYKFEQKLVDAWHDAQQNSQQHALLQLDMDRFKLINDNAGHAAGDQLLRDIGQLLKNVVRQSDICARIGGDEFSVLLLKVTKENTLAIMHKINSAIKGLTFSFNGQIFEVGASIGGTLINDKSPPIAEVKREADAACFIAKNQGINCSQLFDHNNKNVVTHQQEPRWAARIEQAIEKDQFELFFQSIEPINNNIGHKQHIEILLRLRSEGQLLSPHVFLPAVERFRLCAKVDYWVMSKAFNWFSLQPHLWHNLVLAINLSGNSITNEKFIDSIIICQKAYQFPSSAICFEITETAAITNMSMATKMVEKLRFAGFAIALDDFGKGFSTFSYFKNLPAQYIKIDGSYVSDIINNKCDQAIVKAISNMAKALNVFTIAEFVQCDKSVELLGDMGIDFVQGYGIRRPAPLDDFNSIEIVGVEKNLVMNSA